MVEIEHSAGDQYPLAAQYAREEQRLLRNRYGSLLDHRTGRVMKAIGVVITWLKSAQGLITTLLPEMPARRDGMLISPKNGSQPPL